MTLDELRKLLEPHGIRPVKDRGQNFLLDDRVVGKMAEAAGVKAGSRVVEIGPGPGILTSALLERGAEVVAIELDSKLRSLLRGRFGMNVGFRMLEGDALSFPNADIISRFSEPPTLHSPLPAPYQVVANLPYAITSETLRKFLLEPPLPSAITVMVQREVADRVLAAPGKMSALAVLVQTYGRVKRVTNVPAGSFYPPPKVDSTVIHIARKSEAELAAFFGSVRPERYFTVVRTAFAGKRKQLKNTLKALGLPENGLNKAFHATGIAPEQRPEELSVNDWRKLIAALTP